jgi:uncharacterized protein
VKEQLQLLVELQGIDSAIVKKRESLETLPTMLTPLMKNLEDARAAYEKVKHRCEVLEKKKREKERMLDEVHDRVKKMKARISEIKTNKEYQAHLKEIESTDKERYLVEDEILSIMESLENVQKELASENMKVKGEMEKGEALKKKLLDDAAATEQELKELKLRRTEQIRDIPKDLYALYFETLNSKRGLAVVEARNEVCQGCNMNIPPQLFVELKKSERVIQCPQCNRILYWKDEERKEKTDADLEVTSG